MLENFRRKRRPTERTCYWNNVVMDPIEEPQTISTSITRAIKPSEDQCLQLPAVYHQPKRKSPNNCFMVRYKELIRKRHRTITIPDVSIHSKMENDECTLFVTATNNFVRYKQKAKPPAKRQSIPILKEPSKYSALSKTIIDSMKVLRIKRPS